MATQSVATCRVRPWVWTTPFGTPVVPEVKRMSETSSAVTAAARRSTSARPSSVARATNASQPSAPSGTGPSATTTALSEARSKPASRSRARWSVPRKSVTVTSTRAPLRSRMTVASAPLNRVLIGTSTAPAWNRPSRATIQRALLGAQMATRSPGSTPTATRRRTEGAGLVEQLGVGQPHVAVDHGEQVTVVGSAAAAAIAGMVSRPVLPVVIGAQAPRGS